MPDDIGFLTKPAPATGTLTCALTADVPARWVAGDEVYGADPQPRTELETRRVGYVLAIGCDRRIPTQSLTRLAMVAHALLAVIAAREHDLRPAPDGLIALTCNTAPAPATTSANKTLKRERNDLRLEY